MSSIDLNCSAEKTNAAKKSRIVEEKREAKSEMLTRLLITCSLVIMLGILIYASVAA